MLNYCWIHIQEHFSLLALCEGNLSVPSPKKGPWYRTLVSFLTSNSIKNFTSDFINNLLNKWSSGQWFEMLWWSCEATPHSSIPYGVLCEVTLMKSRLDHFRVSRFLSESPITDNTTRKIDEAELMSSEIRLIPTVHISGSSYSENKKTQNH